MSPSELEEFLYKTPWRPVCLTLSSGDQLIVHPADRPIVEGLVLIIKGKEDGEGSTHGVRLVSLPSIVLADAFDERSTSGSRELRE